MMKIPFVPTACLLLLSACSTQTNKDQSAAADSTARVKDSSSVVAAPAPTDEDLTPMTSADFYGIWLLDGDGNDASPHAINGTLNNVTFTSDRDGNEESAGLFNGQSWVAMVDPVNIQVPFSVSAWFNTGDTGEKIQPILSLSRSPDGSGFNFGVQRDRGFGTVYFAFMGADGPIGTTAPYDADGKWHYLTGAYDGKFIRLFLDGRQVGMTPVSPADDQAIQRMLAVTEQPFEIGRELEDLNRYFNGAIDDVMIANRAITESWLNKYFKGKQ